MAKHSQEKEEYPPMAEIWAAVTRRSAGVSTGTNIILRHHGEWEQAAASTS